MRIHCPVLQSQLLRVVARLYVLHFGLFIQVVEVLFPDPEVESKHGIRLCEVLCIGGGEVVVAFDGVNRVRRQVRGEE